jgi:uncharacterized protein YbjT (DUF2867 family)
MPPAVVRSYGVDALVFGASGYIGTHLVPFLCRRGRTVRAAARRRVALEAKSWSGVELVEADALVPATLPAALEGVDVAYYLVHSMATGRDFPAVDRRAAANFRDAAARAGVRRIVYLGGLHPAGTTSAHLASRSETGAVLRKGSVPVTELRAGIIIGPGSAAFEVIRDLVFHLPAMVTPRWVRSRAQPIALADVLEYLARLPERGRRPRRADLRRHDPDLRRYRRTASRDPSCAGADTAALVVLAEFRHLGADERRPRAHRGSCARHPGQR